MMLDRSPGVFGGFIHFVCFDEGETWGGGCVEGLRPYCCILAVVQFEISRGVAFCFMIVHILTVWYESFVHVEEEDTYLAC